MPDHDPVHVAARRVLLDALITLSEHAQAIVLIGAQAVYHHTGTINLPVAPYTTDADIALNPDVLGEVPEIAQAMRDADFVVGATGNPGAWVRTTRLGDGTVEIPVDLLVPESMTPAVGRRSARLQGHDGNSARRAVGIESAIVDNQWAVLESFESVDKRQVECKVAGPSALIVAKAHKISDRLEPGIRSDRRDDKDALDIYRIALAVPMSRMAPIFRSLLDDPRSATTTRRGIDLITMYFGARLSVGTEMATRALEGTVPAPRIADVFMHLSDQLASLRD